LLISEEIQITSSVSGVGNIVEKIQNINWFNIEY
jgi:hypothetical protein